MRLPLPLPLLLVSCLATTAGAEPLRVIQEVDHGAAIGAPFPPDAGIQLEIAAGSEAALSWAPGGRRERINPSNVSFARDPSGAPRVVAFDAQSGELLVLRGAGAAVVAGTRRVRELAGIDARGVALDAANDRLFVLERSRVFILDGVEEGRLRVEWMELPENLPALGGLAFDPTTGHLLALAPESSELIELALDGQLIAVHFMPERAHGARAIAVAPSSDGTDGPERHSLFVAVASPGGGSTFELSLQPLPLAVATIVTPALLETVLTSNYSPPSPDPSGLEVLGSTLLISDGEVDEMSIYLGVNLFETSTSGALLSTSDTTFYSLEPTGVALNPANGHLFTSDDDQRRVWEVTPGADNRINPGDPIRFFSPVVGTDAEGLAYGAGSIWIADGVGAEVWRYEPGTNGVFDGGGDDVITHFDTQILGLTDPEGIAYDTDGGSLYVAGEPQNRIAHISTSGTLLRWLDTSAANPGNPAGLAYGPGPDGDPTWRLYLVARGVDNDFVPDENDGKLFVFGVTPISSGNAPPSVLAGPDRGTELSLPVTLDGSITDDGLPNPPGTLSVTWSQVSGPGTISFANANAVDTSATFSGIGTYVARLTASDTELSASDDVSIAVTSSTGETTVESRVAAGSDDAEQIGTSVSLTSSDLELVTDGTSVQTVGVRFKDLPVPRGVPIQAAWIQFHTDELTSSATSLTIQAEASDNAVTFTSGSNNIAARPRTSASVAWSPPAWTLLDEAGAAQRTPDLSAVVQQIVNRSGWSSNSAIVFIVTGSGTRVARAFESGTAKAPLLHLQFGGAPGNVGPTVSAGLDASVLISQAASLDGEVADDGLPNPPGVVTTSWSQVSGPGTVNFANASAIDTTATFTAAGSYVLRLTADDSAAQASDDVVVTVSSDNQPPSVLAGPDLATELSLPVTLDGDIADDGLPNPPGAVTTSWSQVSGPGSITFANANAVDTTATFSGIGIYVARLTASDTHLSAFDEVSITVALSETTIERRVAAGSDDAEQIGMSVSLTSSDLELVTDGTSVQTVGVRFKDLPVPRGVPIQAAWIQFHTDELTSSATSLTIQAEASDNAVTFTSGSNNIAARPRTSASVAWSPPAWTLLDEAGAAQRTPDLSAVVQQIVNRSGWSSNSAIVFIVTGSGTRVARAFESGTAKAPLLHLQFGGAPGNVGPTVSAGLDASVLISQAASLDGEVADDGLPNPPGVVTTSWSQVSGPGTVNFANASAIDTTATFTAAGSYVLRLTADDSAAQASDDVVIAVIDPNLAGIVESRISTGSDDAEQRVSNGKVTLNGDDLELSEDGSNAQIVGLRFPSLAIPPGAHILNVWIQFRAEEKKTAAASLTISAEANINPGTFTTTTNNVSARPLGTASVPWSPPGWTAVGDAGAAQRTPDLAALVQEAVNRPGWNLGNALVFVISGSGTRTAESVEGLAAGAPLLHLEYGP